MGSLTRVRLRLKKFIAGSFLALMLVVCLALPSIAVTPPCATVTSTDDSASALTTSDTLRYAIAQVNAVACNAITFSLASPGYHHAGARAA